MNACLKKKTPQILVKMYHLPVPSSPEKPDQVLSAQASHLKESDWVLGAPAPPPPPLKNGLSFGCPSFA